MLRKRIIFSLIYNNGYFTQSRNFRLQKVGDLKWLEKNYQFQKIAFSLDEIIVLDASRNTRDATLFADTITRLVDNVFIPISVGGGIRTISDAELLFNSGADKIVLNTSLFKNPDLVYRLAERFGTQSIVASVDYRDLNGALDVFINDGTEVLPIPLGEYIQYLNGMPIGEIYLNSIDKDGTGFGYDIDTVKTLGESICHPLIIAGGAGNEKHLEAGLLLECVSAVATANLFNFIGNGLPLARKNLLGKQLNLAKWDDFS